MLLLILLSMQKHIQISFSETSVVCVVAESPGSSLHKVEAAFSVFLPCFWSIFTAQLIFRENV